MVLPNGVAAWRKASLDVTQSLTTRPVITHLTTLSKFGKSNSNIQVTSGRHQQAVSALPPVSTNECWSLRLFDRRTDRCTWPVYLKDLMPTFGEEACEYGAVGTRTLGMPNACLSQVRDQVVPSSS